MSLKDGKYTGTFFFTSGNGPQSGKIREAILKEESREIVIEYLEGQTLVQLKLKSTDGNVFMGSWKYLDEQEQPTILRGYTSDRGLALIGDWVDKIGGDEGLFVFELIKS